MRSGFRPSLEVTTPSLLFGHNKPGGLLEQVVTYLTLGTNLQVVGERRAGKTSLLKCCLGQLNENSKEYLPIYINFRENSMVRGVGNGYRLLLAHLIVEVRSRGLLPNFFKNLEILNQADLTVGSCYPLLGEMEDQDVTAHISQLVEALNQAGFGIILMIDEYEHLMRTTFEGHEGAFFFLRDLSSRTSVRPKAPKPLTYVIAGALPWDKLCEMIGSPELNNTGALFYISPLDLPDFKKMWARCRRDTSPEFQAHLDASPLEVKDVFDLSGGWPFFGKVIGEHLCTGMYDEEVFFESLFQHFNVIWSRLSAAEHDFFFALAHGAEPDIERDLSGFRSLARRGLVWNERGVVSLRGRLWQRYIREQLQQASARPVPTAPPPVTDDKLRLMVDDISVVVTEINESSLNMTRAEVFRCSNQDVQIYHDLATPAADERQFTHFALSLYNLVFERTVGTKEGDTRTRALERLPKDFRYRRSMVRVIDSVRHHFGKAHITSLDTFNSSGSGMPIGEVLQRYLNSKAKPAGADFAALQVRLLQDLLEYLEELKRSINTPSGPVSE